MPHSSAPRPDPRLIRLFTDGELDATQREQVQSMLDAGGPDAVAAHQQIANERRLKQAVARAMPAVAAPAALRTQITQALADAETAAPEAASDVVGRIDHQGVSQRVGSRGTWMQRLFASPHRANFAAVAAVLTLIAGAVLFGIYGRTIDDVPAPSTVDVVGNVAQYVDKEHGECTSDQKYIQKGSQWRTLAEAEVGLTEALGTRVTAFDLSSLGYTFVGAGTCDVPLEQQPSGHLMYRKSVDGRSGPMVSVFVAPVRGCCKGICKNLPQGQWSAAKASCKRRVLYSTDGQLVYFLVCCDDDDLPPVGKLITQVQTSHNP